MEISCFAASLRTKEQVTSAYFWTSIRSEATHFQHPSNTLLPNSIAVNSLSITVAEDIKDTAAGWITATSCMQICQLATRINYGRYDMLLDAYSAACRSIA